MGIGLLLLGLVAWGSKTVPKWLAIIALVGGVGGLSPSCPMRCQSSVSEASLFGRLPSDTSSCEIHAKRLWCLRQLDELLRLRV
jgi:hypothetical protein